MGIIFKWLIFISSYIPVFLMVFLNNLNSFSQCDIKKTWNINSTFWLILITVSILSIISLAVWLYLLKEESKNKETSFKLDNIQAYDSEVLNYFVTFIIPVVSLKPESAPSIVMNFLLLCIEGIYFVGNNALHFNVLLIIFKYHIYTFGDNNIVVTRKRRSEILFNESRAKQIGTTNIYYL